MKTYIYTILLFLFCFNIVQAQKSNTKRADKLFELKAYAEASELYETKERTQNVLQNLADCYYYNNALEKAVKTYRELFLTYGDSIDNESNFRYGQMLKGVRNYKEADKFLSRYFNERQNTKVFIEELAKTTPHVFEIKPVTITDASNDFGISFFGDDKVVFSSTRNKERPIFAWNNEPYLDLYSATISNDGTLDNIVPFSDAINTETHESNATFSADGNVMFFNRTNKSRKKTDEGKVAHIKIYKAELINGQWTNTKPLPFTSNSYSTEHPSLSKDGRTLYFASDMPGGFGGFDLYKVDINDDESYGEPINLGPSVNTKHREQFPYISDINVLYFASDGHQGFGLLDLFRSNKVNDTFDTPVNLGDKINTNQDDLALVINEKDNTGYFTSNRTGYDKIYKFARAENMLTKYMVSGVVQDKNSKAILPGSLVTLFDEFDTVIQDTIVKDDAAYLFKIEPNKKYKVRGTRKLYIPYDVEFSTDSKGKIQHDIFLNLESYADAEERINKKDDGVVQIDLEKIYFDFDKWDIREDAASILNTLVDLMKKYPEMTVEVSAHTDVRGPDEYNLNLSKKRAASTLEYLVNQGVDQDRLTSIGYGEMQPLNECIKEGICSESDYDVNRRCEFTIKN